MARLQQGLSQLELKLEIKPRLGRIRRGHGSGEFGFLFRLGKPRALPEFFQHQGGKFAVQRWPQSGLDIPRPHLQPQCVQGALI